MLKLFGWSLSAKREKRATFVDVVAEQFADLTARVDRIDALLDELRRQLEATRRKVYRDEEKDTTAERILAQATPPARVYRTGDSI